MKPTHKDVRMGLQVARVVASRSQRARSELVPCQWWVATILRTSVGSMYAVNRDENERMTPPSRLADCSKLQIAGIARLRKVGGPQISNAECRQI